MVNCQILLKVTVGITGWVHKEYMDEAKMGNYENIQKQVLAETTVGERGDLVERESSG